MCQAVRFLKLQGVSVNSSIVRKILFRNGMGSVYDRWLKVEERHLESGLELTAEQVAVKVQPLLQGTAYGILSSRGTSMPRHDAVGNLKGVGKMYLRSWDTYGSYAFSFCTPARSRNVQQPYFKTRFCLSIRNTK